MEASLLKVLLAEIEENNCMLGDNKAHSRKVSIWKISTVTATKRELMLTIVLLRYLPKAREVDIVVSVSQR